MKKKLILSGLLALSVLLSAGGYFGYQYFIENYVLLNQDDVMQLMLEYSQGIEQAYRFGLSSCNKSL